MPKRKNRRAKSKTPAKKKLPKELRKISSYRQRAAVKELSAFVRKSKGKKNVTLQSILKAAGYSDSVCKAPSKVTNGKTFRQLLNHYLPDEEVLDVHGGVLKATRVEHMVFPRSMKDSEIKKVIESVAGCKIKKIKHGEQANHAYFWSPEHRTRLDAVKEAYKIKNKYKDGDGGKPINQLTDEALKRIIG